MPSPPSDDDRVRQMEVEILALRQQVITLGGTPVSATDASPPPTDELEDFLPFLEADDGLLFLPKLGDAADAEDSDETSSRESPLNDGNRVVVESEAGQACPHCDRFADGLTHTRLENRLARWHAKYGYVGDPYCKGCAESFRSHLLLVRGQRQKLGCCRESPCAQCGKVLACFECSPADVYRQFDASRAAVQQSQATPALKNEAGCGDPRPAEAAAVAANKRQRIGGVLGVVGIGAVVFVGQYSGGDGGSPPASTSAETNDGSLELHDATVALQGWGQSSTYTAVRKAHHLDQPWIAEMAGGEECTPLHGVRLGMQGVGKLARPSHGDLLNPCVLDFCPADAATLLCSQAGFICRQFTSAYASACGAGYWPERPVWKLRSMASKPKSWHLVVHRMFQKCSGDSRRSRCSRRTRDRRPSTAASR